MKTVITYGTFDLLHTGHMNLLRRARKLGDRLIVGVTTDSYDQSRGKLNVMESLEERGNLTIFASIAKWFTWNAPRAFLQQTSVPPGIPLFIWELQGTGA